MQNTEQEHGNEPRGFIDRLREGEGTEQVVLYRVNGRALDFLDRYAAASLAPSTEADILADVKTEHGGGAYEMRLQSATGQLIGRHQFSIAGIPKRPREETTVAPAGNGDLVAVLGAMQNQFAAMQAQTMQALERMAQAVTRQEPDQFAMFERFAGMMAQFSGAPQPQKGLIEQFGELEKVMSFAERLKGGGEGGGGFGDLIGMLPTLLETAKAAGAPATVAPAPTPASSAGEGMDAYKPFVMALLTMQQMGQTPEAVAALVMERAENPETLVSFASRPDAVSLLAEVDDRVNNCRAWFEAVAKELAGYEPDEPATTGAAPAAAAARTGGN